MVTKKHMFKIAFWGVVSLVVNGLLVMILWNILLTDLFGFQQIGLLKAIGLLILTRTLFDSGFDRTAALFTVFRKQKNTFREKWGNMSHKERQNFINSRLSAKGMEPLEKDEGATKSD